MVFFENSQEGTNTHKDTLQGRTDNLKSRRYLEDILGVRIFIIVRASGNSQDMQRQVVTSQN